MTESVTGIRSLLDERTPPEKLSRNDSKFFAELFAQFGTRNNRLPTSIHTTHHCAIRITSFADKNEFPPAQTTTQNAGKKSDKSVLIILSTIVSFDAFCQCLVEGSGLVE